MANSHFPIAANPKILIGFLLLLPLCLALAETELLSDGPTAYELLESFDFPKGILPQGVQSYLLRQDGSFEVYFSGDCEFKIKSYLLSYKRKITGTVQSGTLENLSGVRVKVLFLWLGINEVVRSGDDLNFYVGPLSASFALSNFEECPRCRCGFNCATPLASEV